MHYVYRIQSLSYPSRHYTGLTADLHARLRAHNNGCCDVTSPFRPWKLVWYSAFQTEDKARHFETYLKSGSGRAFAKRHLWPD